jgi:hypothetical protein
LQEKFIKAGKIKLIMPKNWRKEIARDTLALGSVPFYALVIARAVVGRYAIFIYQLLIALAVLFMLSRVVKGNMHVARALVLVVFTSLFYNDMLYSIFALLAFILLLLSTIYLKIKKASIAKGILIGAVASLLSYYIASLI